MSQSPLRDVPMPVRAALDAMIAGLIFLDPEGCIVLANEAFAGFVNTAHAELTGRHVGAFSWLTFDGEVLAPQDHPWQGALQSGQPVRNARVCLDDSSNGERLYFIVNCSPVVARGGKHHGVLVSLEDITTLQRKEMELRLARDEAELASRAKSDFLARMSHEIRTPMNAIIGFTDLLKRGYHRNATDADKYLDTIRASARHLLDLIDEILDLSKIEAGKLEIERLHFPVHQAIREVADILSVKAAEKGLEISVEAEGPIPATILSDPVRIRQIMTNLLGNALKFTTHGRIEIRMRLADLATMTISVTDTGVGIPVDKLEDIFNPFVQADVSTKRRFGGTGLGLAISRRYARALGGDVTVRSSLGRGSVFTVTFATGPLDGVVMLSPDRVREPVLIAPDEVGWRWRFAAMRVLVVDDGAENRELVRLILEDVGLRVVEAENGQVALDRYAQEDFDLVMMDMQMPVMDGFTATRRLREQGATLPIVAVTANAMKGFEQELLAVGCTGFLTKPIDIDRLLDTLAGILRARRIQVEQRLEPAAARMAARYLGLGSQAPVISRLADHPRLRGVVGRFALNLAERMHEFEQALAARDNVALAQAAHWLKGAAGTVGFDVFTDPARELEQAAKNDDREGIMMAMAVLRDLAARLAVPEGTTPVPEAMAADAAGQERWSGHGANQ